MAEERTKKNAEVQFNLGSSQLMLIGELLAKASRHYLAGELTQWFFALKNTKMQFISRLNLEERKELKSVEESIIKEQTLYLKTKEAKHRNKMAEYIEDYEVTIKDFLELKGFLVPVKEDTTNIFNQSGYEKG